MTERQASAIGSTLITALDAAWADIQTNHPELPDAVLITGTGAKRNGLTRGHWHPSRWTAGGGQMAEVFLAGERMADGPEGVLCTMLHEASHGIAHATDVKDTSRQGRYHNRRFATIAQTVGLCPPEHPCSKLGFSDCTLADGTAGTYSATLDRLSDALDASIGTGMLVLAAPKGAPRPRVIVACDCRERSLTEKQWDDLSPIICGFCEGRFVQTMEGA